MLRFVIQNVVLVYTSVYPAISLYSVNKHAIEHMFVIYAYSRQLVATLIILPETISIQVSQDIA
jgi:hypothetical protein